MAKLVKSKKVKESGNDINDFLGEKVGITEYDSVDSSTGNVQWNVQQGEVHSSTNLEDDEGSGAAVIIRSFDFKANPQAFHIHVPSKQELFNAHAKQIEVLLWKDGMQVMSDVSPKVMISKNKQNYRIVVGAEPAKGHILSQPTQTLSQITNDPKSDRN